MPGVIKNNVNLKLKIIKTGGTRKQYNIVSFETRNVRSYFVNCSTVYDCPVPSDLLMDGYRENWITMRRRRSPAAQNRYRGSDVKT